VSRIGGRYASISTRLPLTPLALRKDAALLDVSSAIDETAVLSEEPLDFFVDDVALLDDVLEVLEAPEALEVLEVPEGLEEGAFGVKLLLPVPNPRAAASLPLPSTVTISLSFLAVMTSFPLPLIDAFTKAGPELMALIRSATVSSPVEVYFVMLVPSSTLNVPAGRNPSVDSVAVVVSGTVPIPVAGVGDEVAELDDAAVAVFDDDEDDVEAPDGFNAACTAAVSSELTRFKAVPLAMLASPFA
jgi:hypothetical protein